MRRMLIVLGLVCAPVFGQDPATPDPAKAPPKTPEMLHREKNQAAYEKMAPALAEAKNAGRKGWVAIADGVFYPQSAEGRIDPAEEWGPLVALIDRLHPDVPHRYLFQMGEDGDSSLYYTAGEIDHGMGCGLAQALGEATHTELWATPGQIILKSERETIPISEGGPGGFPRVALRVLGPEGDGEVLCRFGFLSAFEGPATVSLATAKELGLARYEIPGIMTLNGTRLCRRARARFRLDKPKAELMIDVAIWPVPAADSSGR